MSAKNMDDKNRWRNVTVSFRMSLEESDQLNTFVKISGLTKQDYIIKRLLYRDVVVQGNPRVHKALKEELSAVVERLKRIEAGRAGDTELMNTICLMNTILKEMRGATNV